MAYEKIKDFILTIGIKNGFHRLPYWVIALLIITFLVCLYSLYFDMQNYLGTYTGCGDCSR